MKRPSEWDRRTYLRGIAVAGIAGSVPVAATAAHDDDDDDDERGPPHEDEPGPPPEADAPMAHPFVGDLDGLNADLDDDVGDMEFNVKNRYAGDPAESGREWVLHYTTDSLETQDYPAAMINLQQRLDKTVTLEDLWDDGEKRGTLKFDFFVGPDHDQYIPGQVYLVIQTHAQKQEAADGEEERAYGVYKNVRKGGPRGEWRTLDVVDEMAGMGTDDPWRTLSFPLDSEGFRANFETFSDAFLQRAVNTRDEVAEEDFVFDDVFDRWDHRSEVLAIGLGSGSSRTPTRRDIYYDNYRLAAKSQEHTFDLPAALEMDVEFRRNGLIIATLTFPDDPAHVAEGVDLQDLDIDSVRLHPFAQIMPPQDERSGARPTRVDVHDDRIEARFPPGRVRSLEGLGGGQRRVAVAGEFDYEHVVWFFGIGDVRVPGN